MATQVNPGGALTRRLIKGIAAVLLVGAGIGALGWVILDARRKSQAGIVGLLARSSKDYGEACQRRAEQHATDVQAGRYIPPDLAVHTWRGLPPDPAHVVVSEDALIESLAKGDVRIALLEARSGLGKTSLADAIDARTCATLPVLRLDLVDDVEHLLPTLRAKDNPIAELATGAFGLPEEERQMLMAMLAREPVLLLLDSLDEVSLANRKPIVEVMRTFVQRHAPYARMVIFTRPPVYGSNMGLEGIDADLEIPPIDCARAEERVASALKVPERQARFWAFAQKANVARRVDVKGTCRMPHLASYRDVKVVLDVGEDLGWDPVKAAAALPGTRVALYQHYVRVMLRKGCEIVSLTPEAALSLIERMVADQNPASGIRAPVFTKDACVATIRALGLTAPPETCEALLQSGLFKRVRNSEVWRFSNQSVGDYFLASWADKDLAPEGRLDCARVTERAPLYESSEVATMLVGLPNGSKCLGHVVSELCRRTRGGEETYELLDQGLPATEARRAIVRTGKQAATGLPYSGCSLRLLDRAHTSLFRTP